MEQITAAIKNSSGEKGSLLLVTSFGHYLLDPLVRRGRGKELPEVLYTGSALGRISSF